METDELLNNVLNNLNTFTKEEYELINTYQMKSLAKYDLYKYDLLKNTEPRYFQSLTIMSRFKDLALQHKQMVLNTTMEHLQLHKEILLQLLSILQALVQNPNVVDVLISFLNSEWYSGQDFKEFISSLIDQEMKNINTLYGQMLILTTKPLICYIPEIFNSQNTSIDAIDLTDFYTTLNEKYILEP